MALKTLSSNKLAQGHLPIALSLDSQAVLLAETSGDLYQEMLCRQSHAYTLVQMGDYQQASTLYAKVEKVRVALGIQPGLEMNMQAEIHFRKSEYNDARRINEAIVKLKNGIIQSSSKSYALLNIILIDLITGRHSDLDNMRADLANICHSFSVNGSPIGCYICDLTCADIDVILGNLDSAHDCYLKVLASIRGSNAETESMCLEGLSDLAKRRGNETLSFHYTVLSFVFGLKIQDKAATHHAMRRLAEHFQQQNDEDSALSLFHTALDGFDFMDIHQGRAICMLRIADIMRKRGQIQEPRELWSQAQALFMRASQEKFAEDCAERLARA